MGERHIILFVLPAHTSHVLQPMDVGCFGPFEKIYCNLRYTYMREHSTKGIEKHCICRLGCQAYTRALTQANLQASFRKCGIFPFNRHAVNKSHFVPAQLFKSSEDQAVLLEESNNTNKRKSSEVTDVTLPPSATGFFSQLEENMFSIAKPTKKRKVMSAIVGGRAITDDSTFEKMKDHQKSHPPPKKQIQKKSSVVKRSSKDSPKPSTSGTAKLPPTQVDTDSDSNTDDDEVGCHCNLFQPVEIKESASIMFVTWAQCTHPTCQHWSHLKVLHPCTSCPPKF
ncbi:uncharacterized protein LOC121390755 [Gigantopelta aegis]|uniref:uncharacterized protein LOC121390755 n=1 Tax=Gigantopelta aegis TaxID=1735272 RepID=UPI001B88E65A|nr:uncharacterized protein LOC121390755 [Gigantopelta aegis]